MKKDKISRRTFLKLILTSGLALTGTPLTKAEPQGGFKEFDVSMRRYSYSPSLFRVSHGDSVRFKLRSTDVMHGFHISGYDINETVHRKEPKTLEFTADKTGTFPIKCSVTCGPMHPVMQGKLVVEPNQSSWFALALGFLAPIGMLGYLVLRSVRHEEE